MSYRSPLSLPLMAALCTLSLVLGALALTTAASAQEADAPAVQQDLAPGGTAAQNDPGTVYRDDQVSAGGPAPDTDREGEATVTTALQGAVPEPAGPELAAPEPDPFPSPFSDPEGALRWLLTQTEAGSHNLSPIGMYRSADIVVKLVMLGLIFASLVTWTVWLAKTLELWGARGRAGRALRLLVRSATLQEARGGLDPGRGVVGRMLAEAAEEVAQAQSVLDHAGGTGLKERVAAALERIEAEAGRRMGRGTGVLATIGATAPFVGLFGTVWGIMNSFISIAESNTTNLAVVAPGIAEALLATALGLVAAIPAVVTYNLFARSIAGYRLLLGHAGERIERLVSRDLDQRLVPQTGAGVPVRGPAPLSTPAAV